MAIKQKSISAPEKKNNFQQSDLSSPAKDRKQAQEALRQSEEKYRTILENIQEGYFEIDLAGNFTFFNDSMCRIIGYPKEQLIGMNYRQCTDKENSKKLFQAFNKAYNSKKPTTIFDWQITKKDGTTRLIEASASLQTDSSGDKIGFQGIARDITVLKRTEQRLQYTSNHDTLTGLPNRLILFQTLKNAIKSAQQHKQQFAILFIDIDRFKIINESFDYHIGDQLLQEIASRIKQALRPVDIIARMGGDEFVILIEEVNDVSHVSTIAHKLLSAITEPVNIMGLECCVTASIGISLYPQDAEDDQSLIKNAEIAMYFVKEEGKNNYKFYTKDMKSPSIERLSIETNLRSALERKEFSLQYQPSLDSKTGVITSVEVLLRWQNQHLGSVSPRDFIPVAEETGLIIPIGRWVIKTACAQNAAWQRQGLPAVRMSINMSFHQLTDINLMDDINAAIKESGTAPDLLELEINETVLKYNAKRLTPTLIKIKNLGVRLTIDNFGTGYFPLSYLKKFPIDTIKVDQSLIHNINKNAEGKAIAKTIITMGKALSFNIIAKGVEKSEQKDFFHENTCDEMQGFYFSKPVTSDEFADLLRKHNPSLKPLA